MDSGEEHPRKKPQRHERFERLVREHARVMASAIRRVCGRRYRALVPDVEQEVYLALWKRLRDGNEIEYPVSYLYKVALTTALGVVRRVEREAPLPEGRGDPEVPHDPAPDASGLSSAERAVILRETLDRLESDESRALRGYLAGFNHTEVAELYGWSESAARHRIYRTLEQLRTEARKSQGERDERRKRD